MRIGLIFRDTDKWGCVKGKEVDVIWMNTWRIPNRTNNMTRGCCFFFSLYMYLSYIFYFKEKHNYNKRKTKSKTNTKKIYRNDESKSLPIVFDYVLPIRKSFPFFFFLFFFFQLVLKLHPYLLAPFTIKGRKSLRSPYLFSYSFPSFGEEQKSLLFVFKVGIQF